MKVLKFGGSSLADADRIKMAAKIIQNSKTETSICVVLSAMKGITDLLINITQKSERNDASYHMLYTELTEKHNETVRSLVKEEHLRRVLSKLQPVLEELKDILHGIELIKECSPRSLDLVLSFGERLSCMIVSEYLQSIGIAGTFIDARDIIVTDESYGNASVYYRETYEKIRMNLTPLDTIPIITGFIGSTKNGVTTTLGRNGSDFTASIIGAAIDASVIEIWTDVDGVLSADPNEVEDAFLIPEISIQEAMELSYFGAKVIHPYTMIPAVEKNIPIKIKNTFNSTGPGTTISQDVKKSSLSITGIASIPGVSLINVEGGGMLGTPGIASHVFSALAKKNINIIMISQASSEHSICIVCLTSEAYKALQSLESELIDELKTKKIQKIDIIDNLEIIAVIGENMRGTPGVSGKVFSALGQKKINVLAIAQGSSERNISFVVSKKDKKSALNILHTSFFDSGKNQEQ